MPIPFLQIATHQPWCDILCWAYCKYSGLLSTCTLLGGRKIHFALYQTSLINCHCRFAMLSSWQTALSEQIISLPMKTQLSKDLRDHARPSFLPTKPWVFSEHNCTSALALNDPLPAVWLHHTWRRIEITFCTFGDPRLLFPPSKW